MKEDDPQDVLEMLVKRHPQYAATRRHLDDAGDEVHWSPGDAVLITTSTFGTSVMVEVG